MCDNGPLFECGSSIEDVIEEHTRLQYSTEMFLGVLELLQKYMKSVYIFLHSCLFLTNLPHFF